MSLSEIIIGTRASALALWQAQHVKQLIESHHQIPVIIKKITTKGDQIVDRSLVAIGGKGLFVKEIEDELLEGTIGIAVHSMKDVPHSLPSGLILPAMLPRDDPRDVLVSRENNQLSDLPEGAVVGTTSLRRLFQVKTLRPDLEFKNLRGNVDTRLKKLDAGEYKAVILAAAGLKRLGLGERITEYLDIVPAVGQGAIGIECCEQNSDLVTLVSSLNDAESFCAVGMERYFARRVGATCQTPLACYIRSGETPGTFHLSIYHAGPDGSGASRHE
ncbi:MAG: porphobilinogen deaminase, partial [uncultured bacterium]